MPSRIRILDEHTINKIAAGEVIESPASVVKELVENSLDAGAKDICVEIKGGGRQLIRVTDDGCGMTSDDAVLCLERHATSKIKEVEDILSTHTMGFRGEAIPSIASVSKFTILTHARDENEGTLVIVDGGRLVQCGKAACSPGTTIEVKSLFFNVPVRKKFQKSPAYDGNEILKMLTTLALGHPTVKFQLIDNQKKEIQTHVLNEGLFIDQLKDRISTVMGSELLAGCCQVDISSGDSKLQGYIGLPAFSRLNRTGQYLFINGRAVFSPLISHLVREAYGTILPANKYPIFILHLFIPGDIIDVNVHPQKKEVRIRQDHSLKEMILSGVQKAIQGKTDYHSLFEPILESISYKSPEFPMIKPAFSFQESREKKSDQESPYYSLNPIPVRTFTQEIPPFASIPSEKRSFPKVLNTIPNYIILDALSLESWKAVPQDGLCLLDQKAAHSRVIFENLIQTHSGAIATQSLLIPFPLNLPTHEASFLRLNLDKFIANGIHIQEIGANSFLIDALPDIFGNVDVAKLIIDLIENMRDYQEEQVLEKELERRIAISASQAAVHSNKRFQMEEAQSLVNRLFRCQTPFLCPKGKPTLSYIGAEELIKRFQKTTGLI